MGRHRLMGIDPNALEGAMQERRERHRLALDQLRARLAAAEGGLGDLLERQADLITELARLEEAEQGMLQELNQLGEEADRPRRELLERHHRAEAQRQESIRLMEQERASWRELERQVAEGVMRAVQPYLDLNAIKPYLDLGAEPHQAPGSDWAGAVTAIRRAIARAAPSGQPAPPAAPASGKEGASGG